MKMLGWFLLGVLISNSSARAYVPFSVSSGGDKNRVEFASMGAPPSCSVLSTSSSNWITLGSSGGTGDCAVTIRAGTFTGAPMCLCTTGAPHFCSIQTITSSTFEWGMYTITATPVNDTARIVCFGPRP